MDKKLNLNLSLGKSAFSKLLKNLSWMFFLLFVVLLVLEGMEVQKSVALISELSQEPQAALPKHSSLDRIDFDTYNKNLQKEQNAQNFVPSGDIPYDPFNGIGTPQSGPIPTSTPVVIPIASSTLSTATSTGH